MHVAVEYDPDYNFKWWVMKYSDKNDPKLYGSIHNCYTTKWGARRAARRLLRRLEKTDHIEREWIS